MKQKFIIVLGIVLLLVLILVMSYDLFIKENSKNSNVYEYNLDKLKKTDTTLVSYAETRQLEMQENNLYGIAIDKDDNVFVSAGSKILLFNNRLEKLKTFSSTDKVLCMATGDKGLVYLGCKNHIEVIDTTGNLVKKWDIIDGIPFITSIAVDKTSVFAADAGNKVIHQFNLQGEKINEIGKKDPERGIPGLFIPSPYFDVLIGTNGEVIAINTGRHSFEFYTQEGDLVKTFNKTSMSIEGFSGCCNPSNVAILSDGSFVTSEKGIERVKIHGPDGEFKCIVASPDQFKPGTKGLDLAVDSKDKIYVLDPEKKMIRIFEKI
ncbi:MAG: hypothetical protein U0W24_07270 [Bacteroidales bacterium]